jgi:GntR family transcriptional regulator, transcriptional repressor for pyruvate dehydrogenase complex
MNVNELDGGQVWQPSLGETVADILRKRILDGRIAGSTLPSQESLMKELGLSKPPLREALRILQAEGLISVRRGNVGGSVIHRPGADHAAYSLALVLQSKQVTIDDVGTAVKRLQGLCAGLSAAREDRLETVVPALAECNERARAQLDDELAYFEATAQFHSVLISGCGNETLGLLVGSAESVWYSHAQEWAEITTREGEFPDYQYRLAGLEEHEEITRFIARGQVAEVVALAEEHIKPPQFYRTPRDRDRVIDVSVIGKARRRLKQAARRAL